MKNQKHLLSAVVVVALAGCGSSNPAPDTGTNPGTDGGGVDSGAGTSDCGTYCSSIMAICTGDNAQYASAADCMAQCTELSWPAGTAGATSGNTLACRTYHAGAARDMMMPAVHCPHAGPTGGGVCGSLTIRAEASTTFTRVDRMGMPAVSTVLVSSANKDAYNDANPSDDTNLAGFPTSDLLPNLTGLHGAIDNDLRTLGLAPCSMTTLVGGLPQCVGQSVGTGGPTVASLVIPDTLQVNPAMPSGFPNGRRLADPVIDVTLAVILLDLSSATGCASGPCTPTTLAAPTSLNPSHNDATTTDTFPYLAAAHAAP